MGHLQPDGVCLRAVAMPNCTTLFNSHLKIYPWMDRKTDSDAFSLFYANSFVLFRAFPFERLAYGVL